MAEVPSFALPVVKARVKGSEDTKDTPLKYNAGGFPLDGSAYTLTAELGSGAYATVYRARCALQDGKSVEVAAKVLELDRFEGKGDSDDKEFDMLYKEVSIMSAVKHDNVVSILAAFVEERELWLIMPLLEGGSCLLLMRTLAPTGIMDESCIATVLLSALRGLEYLHKNGMIHRDIKAGNIFVGADGSVVLGDLGVAGLLIEKGQKANVRTFVGTPCYMAPEVVEQAEGGYNVLADIWSFGILAMELAYGAPPYSTLPPLKIMMLLLTKDPPTCETFNNPKRTGELSKEFKQLVQRCMVKDHHKRPSASELLKDKYFKKFAKSPQYLQENLVSRLPAGYLGAGSTAHVPRHRSRDKRGDYGKDLNKPVTIGSFVFESDEFDEQKRREMHAEAGDLPEIVPEHESLPEPLGGNTNMFYSVTATHGASQLQVPTPPSPPTRSPLASFIYRPVYGGSSTSQHVFQEYTPPGTMVAPPAAAGPAASSDSRADVNFAASVGDIADALAGLKVQTAAGPIFHT